MIPVLNATSEKEDNYNKYIINKKHSRAASKCRFRSLKFKLLDSTRVLAYTSRVLSDYKNS